MNEWSPGGNHIRPETPKHTGRSLRSQWDESDTGPRTGTVNLRTASDNRTKSRHHFKENTSKTSLNICNKARRKVGDAFVTSDPRFKRIISPGNQNSVCIGTEIKKSKSTLDLKDALKSKPADWTPAEFKPKQPIGDSAENTERNKSNPLPLPDEPESKNTNEAKALKPEQSQDNLKLVEKLGFNHSLVETFSKESLSDSCISTRNASLASEESGPDFSNNLNPFSSATRVKKVQHWIQDQQTKLEKKQSVVTVIGQTQGFDTLSSALQEIDKRRKLVKQLDKYAVCRKILDSEKDIELSELLAKVSCFTQAGKIWGCGDSNEHPKMNITEQKVTEENIPDKYYNVSDNEKIVTDEKSKCDMFECEPVKRKSNKIDAITEYILRDFDEPTPHFKNVLGIITVTGAPMISPVRLFFSRISYQWIIYVVIFLCAGLCCIMYVTAQRSRYVSFDLFTPKPKPLTWYEKIGIWIWELFRPSANYQRIAPWQQYLN